MGLKIYCPTEFRHLCRVSLFYLKDGLESLPALRYAYMLGEEHTMTQAEDN